MSSSSQFSVVSAIFSICVLHYSIQQRIQKLEKHNSTHQSQSLEFHQRVQFVADSQSIHKPSQERGVGEATRIACEVTRAVGMTRTPGALIGRFIRHPETTTAQIHFDCKVEGWRDKCTVTSIEFWRESFVWMLWIHKLGWMESGWLGVRKLIHPQWRGSSKKKVPDKVEGQFILIRVHYTSSRFLMLFPGLRDLEIVVFE